METRSGIHTFFVLSVVFLVFQCAGQGAPGGGPKDDIPPRIIAVTPAQDSTNVPTDTEVRIAFSESVYQKTLEDAIFIAPYAGENAYDFDWKGRDEVVIRFSDSLRKDETYVVTVGASVEDIREKNKMAASYQFAFSTGEKIDQGEIAGRVYEEDAKGAFIWAYRLDILKADTLKLTQYPDYIIQTDENGRFRLRNLKVGDYRLFAMTDKNKNRVYDVESDLIGMTTTDVQLADTANTFSDLQFRMTVQDTTPPRIVSAIALDHHHIEITFSEPVNQNVLTEDSTAIQVTDTLGAEALQIVGWYSPSSNPSNLFLMTDTMAFKEYLLSFQGVGDLSGNLFPEEAQSVVFIGSEKPDTTRPQIKEVVPGNGSVNILPDQPVIFRFDDGIDSSSIRKSLVIQDTLKNPVTGEFQWLSLSEVHFIPQNKLASKTEYQIDINTAILSDRAGNVLGDTLLSYHFTTINTDTFGLVSGSIRDDKETQGGTYVVSARSTGKEKRAYQIRLTRPENFLFDAMLPGDYLFEIFYDRDGNGVYSYGEPSPFLPAERFAVYPDTVQVRLGGWETTGVRLHLKDH